MQVLGHGFLPFRVCAVLGMLCVCGHVCVCSQYMSCVYMLTVHVFIHVVVCLGMYMSPCEHTGMCMYMSVFGILNCLEVFGTLLGGGT